MKMSPLLPAAVFGLAAAVQAQVPYNPSGPAPTGTNTIIQYNLDSTSGSTLIDAANPVLDGNNFGTLTGTNFSWVAGQSGFGNALQLNPVFSGGAIISNSTATASFNSAEAVFPTLTMSAWVNPAGVTGGGGSYVMGLTTIGGGRNAYIRFDGSSNEFVRVAYQTDEWIEVSSGLPGGFAGKWTHVAGTYDNGTVALYVNGVKIGENTKDAGYGPTFVNGLVVGATPWDTSFQPSAYSGLVDDIRVMNAPAPLFSIVDWQFEETAGATAADAANPVLDGPNTGAISGTNYAWTTGYTGGGLRLSPDYDTNNPSCSYVATPMNSAGNLFNGQQATMAAWINPDAIVPPGGSYVCGAAGGGGAAFIRIVGGGTLSVGYQVLDEEGNQLWIDTEYPTSFDFIAGQWNHVAATIDKGVVTLWLNGSELATNDTQAGRTDLRVPQMTTFVVGVTPWDTSYKESAYSGLVDGAQMMNVVNPAVPPLPPGGLTYAAWAALFPSLTDTSGAADPDGDGFDNNKEYAFGGNPTVGTPSLLAMVSTDASFIALDEAAGDYTVQQTTNLATGPWTNAATTFSVSTDQSGIPLADYYTRLQFSVPPGSGAQSFFRVLYNP